MPHHLVLQGHHAIVTGGGRGIGRGIALALASAGAHVTVLGRSADSLRGTVAQIGAAGGAADLCVIDLTNPAATMNAVQNLSRDGTRFHVLVNNAGSSSVASLADSGETWGAVIEANLTAMHRLCRLVVPVMHDEASIINIASILALRGTTDGSAYCASKHAVLGLTRALALELAPRRITVNAICPGWVATEMTAGVVSAIAGSAAREADVRRSIVERIPLGRMVAPEEIGGLAVFLASRAARMITGQPIVICGGQTVGV